MSQLLTMRHRPVRGLLAALTLAAGLFAAPGWSAGLLTPADGSLPALEIRDHQVEVLLLDGYAVTSVDQVFHNPHARDLEATYSFPVPEHGSVAELRLWIDGQPVTGEVLAKAEAETLYEAERAAGQEAALASKDAYRTFEVRVSPVRAGQDTRVELVYLQPIKIDHGIGRYLYPLEEGGVDEERLAFWTAEDRVRGRFQFDVKLRSGYPVEAVRVPGRPDAVVARLDERRWDLRLGDSGRTGVPGAQQAAEAGPEPGSTFAPDSGPGPDLGSDPGYDPGYDPGMAPGPSPAPDPHQGQVERLDRDIVVYWRLDQHLPGSLDLITHKPDASGRGTFLLTLTPGSDLAPVTGGTDWVFVLDVSGSMQGKYATLAEGVRQALGKLRPDDRFRVVTFNNRAGELTQGYVAATPEAVHDWSGRVAAVQPNGGTNLYAGLDLGLSGLDADRASGLVLVTDGVANLGQTEQRDFLELLRRRDVRLFTFVMGNSANRPLLETLTQASNGFARSISNSDDIVGEILAASSKLTHQALHGLRLEIRGVRVADLTPTQPDSLYRGQQAQFLGHYWGDGEAEIRLSGRIAGQDQDYATRIVFPERAETHPELERLWAYDRIRELQRALDTFGEDADQRDAIVDLATEYGLVTQHTSMVVVRDAVFERLGIERRNASRAEVERAARSQALAQTPAQTPAQTLASPRADQAQPMFSGTRATHSSGGGGAGALSASDVLLLLLGALAVTLARRAGRQGGRWVGPGAA